MTGAQGKRRRGTGRRSSSFAAALGCLLTQTAAAVDPAAAQWGPLSVEPQLFMDLQWVDNLYRTRRDTVDSWILTTRPSVRGWLQNGPSSYGLTYELEDLRYEGTPAGEDDDFTRHRLRGDLHQEFNAKNLLQLHLQYHRTSEERGTGLTEGALSRLTDEPVGLDHSEWGAGYTYGNRQTTAMLEVDLQGHQYDYQNFRSTTRYFDYDRRQARGTFYWNLSGRTALLAEAGYALVDYDRRRPGQPALDAEELRLLAGLSWQARGKTRGAIKLGAFERDFDDAALDTANGFSWDVTVTWEPRTHSTVDFATRQVSRETNGLGDFINSHELELSWAHGFRRGYRSSIQLLIADDEYSESERDDTRFALEWELNRTFRRWLDLGVGWRYEDRDSDLQLYSYRRNALFARMRLSL